MGPGFGHFWIRDGRAGLGAVTCERKLWITGLTRRVVFSRERVEGGARNSSMDVVAAVPSGVNVCVHLGRCKRCELPRLLEKLFSSYDLNSPTTYDLDGPRTAAWNNYDRDQVLRVVPG